MSTELKSSCGIGVSIPPASKMTGTPALLAALRNTTFIIRSCTKKLISKPGQGWAQANRVGEKMVTNNLSPFHRKT